MMIVDEKELCIEIKSGAFSMQVADCERNIRIQFEKLQQENKQLKEENEFLKSEIEEAKRIFQKYLEYIDKAIEYIENIYYLKNTTPINSIVLSNNELLKIRKILKEVE